MACSRLATAHIPLSIFAYFFNLDDAERIYKDDIRINKKFTLYEEKQQEILKNKRFEQYHFPSLRELQSYNKT